MKRQELKALLHGVENAGEIIDQIMEINGADIENAKKTAGGGNDAVSRENERRFGTPFSPSCLHASSPYRFLHILRTPFLTEIEFGVTIRLDRFNTSDGKTTYRSKTPPFGLKTVFLRKLLSRRCGFRAAGRRFSDSLSVSFQTPENQSYRHFYSIS